MLVPVDFDPDHEPEELPVYNDLDVTPAVNEHTAGPERAAGGDVFDRLTYEQNIATALGLAGPRLLAYLRHF